MSRSQRDQYIDLRLQGVDSWKAFYKVSPNGGASTRHLWERWFKVKLKEVNGGTDPEEEKLAQTSK